MLFTDILGVDLLLNEHLFKMGIPRTDNGPSPFGFGDFNQ